MSTILARQHLVFHRGRQGWTIAAVAVLHVALLWAVMRPLQQTQQHDERVWLQLLQPRQRAAVPATLPIAAAPAPATASESQDQRVASPVATPRPAPAPIPLSTPDNTLRAEAEAAAPQPDAMPLAQQALQAAGAIDRQLRAEHPQQFVAPPDTPQARLAKGFAEAHAAVKPKWFEAARIELWSAPNDPKRIYRVITATGEYCIYMPDKGNMTLNLSARSGYAGFGGGTAAPCPIRF